MMGDGVECRRGAGAGPVSPGGGGRRAGRRPSGRRAREGAPVRTGRRAAVGVAEDVAAAVGWHWRASWWWDWVRVVGFVGAVVKVVRSVPLCQRLLGWFPVGGSALRPEGLRRCFAPLSLAIGWRGFFQVPYLNGAPRVLASPVALMDCSLETGGISPSGPVAILMLTGGGRGSRWERLGRWQSGTDGGVMAGVVTGGVDGSRYGRRYGSR